MNAAKLAGLPSSAVAASMRSRVTVVFATLARDQFRAARWKSWRATCKKKGVRIATLRSMSPSVSAPLLKDTQRAGASFFEVLASTSGPTNQSSVQSADQSRMRASAAPLGASPKDSDAAELSEKAAIDTAAEAKTRNQNNGLAIVAASADRKSSPGQASPSPVQLHSISNASNRAIGRDERPQMASASLAAKIAATVVLPSAAPVAAAAAILTTAASVAFAAPFSSSTTLSAARTFTSSAPVSSVATAALPLTAPAAATIASSPAQIPAAAAAQSPAVPAAATTAPASLQASAATDSQPLITPATTTIGSSPATILAAAAAQSLTAPAGSTIAPAPLQASAATASQSLVTPATTTIGSSPATILAAASTKSLGAPGAATIAPAPLQIPSAFAAQPLVEAEPQEQSRELNRGIAQLPDGAIANHGAAVPHSEAKSEAKAQTPGTKSTDESSDIDEDTASQSVAADASSPDGSKSFALPQGAVIPSLLPGSVIVPDFNLMPGNGDASQPTGKALQNNRNTVLTSANSSITAIAPGAGKDNLAGAPSVSSDSTAQNSSGGNQTVQKPQADASQAALAAPRPVDSGSAQMQGLATPSVPREITASHGQADRTGDLPRTSDQPLPAQTADSPATSAINTARLIQNMSESEMRVGMHSAEFGDISIRTSVSQQQMMAQISVDHGDLGRAISAHIPAMQEKLGGETGLRASVEVSHSGMSFSDECLGFASWRNPLAPLFG